MGDEIRDPRRNLPISILLGGVIAGFIYFGTTLSMLIAMPQKEIGVLSGVLQAINVMSARTGLESVVAPLALLECIAILGTASAWFSGAARLPFVAGVDRYLPPIIGRLHPRYHTPYVSLILFAVLSSLLIASSFLGVSVGEAYLTMLDLAVILQLAPSAYMFLALLKHTWSKGAVLNANRAYLTVNAVAGLCRNLYRSDRRLHSFAPGQLGLDLRRQTHRGLPHRVRRRPILLSARATQGPHRAARYRSGFRSGIRLLSRTILPGRGPTFRLSVLRISHPR